MIVFFFIFSIIGTVFFLPSYLRLEKNSSTKSTDDQFANFSYYAIQLVSNGISRNNVTHFTLLLLSFCLFQRKDLKEKKNKITKVCCLFIVGILRLKVKVRNSYLSENDKSVIVVFNRA